MGKEITFKDLVIILLKNIKVILITTCASAICFSVWGAFQDKTITKALMFFVVGASLGFVVCYIIVALKIIHSKFITNATDIRSRYRIPVLAVIPSDDKQHTTINKLIDDLTVKEYGMEKGVQYEIAKESLYVLANQHKVFLTGSVPFASIEQDYHLIQFDSSLPLPFYNCLLETPKTIKALNGVDGVILIEKCGNTTFDKFNRQIFQLEALGKEIYGVILI